MPTPELAPVTQSGAQMAAQAIGACSIGAAALAQLVKFIVRPPDRWGALIVVMTSLGIVSIWAFDKGLPLKGNLYELFMSWMIVATSAAGIFGFSKSTTGAVADFKERRAEEK